MQQSPVKTVKPAHRMGRPSPHIRSGHEVAPFKKIRLLQTRPLAIDLAAANGPACHQHGTRRAVIGAAGAVFGAEKVNFSSLRASVGVALQWQAPVGPISISYALPLNDGEFDRVERLQFTFGQQF